MALNLFGLWSQPIVHKQKVTFRYATNIHLEAKLLLCYQSVLLQAHYKGCVNLRQIFPDYTNFPERKSPGFFPDFLHFP